MSRSETGVPVFPPRRRLAAGLMLALTASGLSAAHYAGAATIHTVTNCLDSGAGSLRDTIAAATTLSGDTVKFSAQLGCSTITLSSGQIVINQNDLTLLGPGASALAIDAAFASRVLLHDPGGTNPGTLSITGVTITHGKTTASSGAVAGSCLFSTRDIVLTNSTVSSCLALATGSANVYGAGIYTQGDLTLIHSRVAYNIAVGPSDAPPVFHRVWGGGAFVAGNLQASYSAVVNNSVYTPDHRGTGGGLYTYGNAQVGQSTISGNRADVVGGWGARSLGGNTISIVNSTISGNYATETIGAMSTLAPLTLSSSTVAFNHTGLSRGGLYARATLTLHSSIVADNTAIAGASDITGYVGTTVTGVNNLITSSTLTVPADTISACPKLGPLANNGGATFTHALAHDSPAINHGNGEQFPPTDQRGTGFPRPFGAGVDIGAYEWQGTPDDRLFVSRFESSCDS